MAGAVFDAFRKDEIKQAEMCWNALKVQLNTHDPDKQKVKVLCRAMISYVNNLSIVGFR